MAERAKLRYGGRSYLDSDLRKICEKEAKFKGMKFQDYRIDRNMNCIVVLGVYGGQNSSFFINFEELVHYNVGTNKGSLVVDGVVYDDLTLKRIGNEVASLWGGYSMGYTVDKRRKVVVFECIEHGENFGTEIGFYELKDYKR